MKRVIKENVSLKAANWQKNPSFPIYAPTKTNVNERQRAILSNYFVWIQSYGLSSWFRKSTWFFLLKIEFKNWKGSFAVCVKLGLSEIKQKELDLQYSKMIIFSWTPVTMSWTSSGPKFCVVWLWNMPASGWRSLWESSSFVPWFVLYAFRDVPGAVSEWPWTGGCWRKSSERNSAPKMLSVLVNSWDNFFVTLPSISLETWVI